MRESRRAGAMPRGGRLRWITLGLLVATAVPQAEAHPSARPEPFPDRTVQAPPNDHLADAITIDALPFVDEQDATQATSEPLEALSSCAGEELEHGVWYRLRLAVNDTVVVDTASSGGADGPTDTVLSVWTGTGHPLTEVACNDDADGADVAPWSQVRFRAEADTAYFVKAAGWADWSGPITLHARVAPPPPENDALADAVDIALDALPFVDERDTSSAADDPDEVVSQCNADADHGVWYRVEPTSPTAITFSTEGSASGEDAMDTVLSVWTGGPGHPLEEVYCNDDVSEDALWSRLALDLVPGRTYFVKAAGYDGAAGSVWLRAWRPGPPANDELASAVRIESLPFSDARTTEGATDESGEERASCAHAEGPERAVWYRYTAAADGQLAVDTSGDSIATVLSAWEGDAGHPLEEVACTTSPRLILPVESGRTYVLKVGGLFGAMGWLQLVVALAVFPANDDVAGAIVVATTPFSDTVSTVFADDEPDERRASCAVAGQQERAVWYRYVAPADLTLAVEASGAASVLSLWHDGAVHPLVETRCSSPTTSASGVSVIEEPVVAGEAVLIKLGPFASVGATVTLHVSERAGGPANDDLTDAVMLADLPFRHEADTEAATDEPEERLSSCMVSVPGVFERGVWYRFSPSAGGGVRVSTEGSSFDTVLSIWQGPPRHPLDEIDCNDDAGGAWSEIEFETVAGTTYFVKAGGQAGNAGHLVIEVEAVDLSAEAGVFLPFLARNAPIP